MRLRAPHYLPKMLSRATFMPVSMIRRRASTRASRSPATYDYGASFGRAQLTPSSRGVMGAGELPPFTAAEFQAARAMSVAPPCYLAAHFISGIMISMLRFMLSTTHAAVDIAAAAIRRLLMPRMLSSGYPCNLTRR